MMAVSVPGLAVIVTFSSSAFALMLNPTSRTSRPPVRVAASVRRTRMPPVNTRSTLPIVTTSPSVSTADPTRIPLTNVPLMLCASRISVPIGVGARYAWWRDASTSWMTMSLSIARPIAGTRGRLARRSGSRFQHLGRDLRHRGAFGHSGGWIQIRLGARRGLGRWWSWPGCLVAGPADAAVADFAQRTAGRSRGRTSGRRDHRDRLRRRQLTDRALVMSDFEGHPRPVGLADVDALAVVDVDHRHPLAFDEHPVERVVVDRHPPALIEAQQHVRAGDQRVGHAQVGAQVTADDHVAARREAALGSVSPNRQHGLRGSIHRFSVA